MVDFTSRRCLVGLALAALVLGGVVPAVQAQQLGSKADTEEPYLREQARFNKLRDGEAKPEPKDKSVIEVAARYFVFRVTWTTIQNDKSPDSGMPAVHARFRELMQHPATVSGKNKEFMKLLAHEMVGCLKQVLKLDFKDNYQSVTNGALMLPWLAKCRQDDVDDYLLDLAKAGADGKPVVHPFIRMCAVKGLGEFNAPGEPRLDDPNDEKAQANKRARDQARVQVILQFIAQPYPPQGSTPDYQEAFAFVRREGVKALAKVPAPAISIDKGKVAGPVAYYLLYIINNGNPGQEAPPFALAEKLEAALGVLQLRPVEGQPYNAELAAYGVAVALVEFANAYANDYPYFSLKDKEKDAPKRLAKLPWQAYAGRFEAGLDTMYASLPKDSPAVKKVAALRSNVANMLSKIGQRKQIDAPTVLIDSLEGLRPAVNEVYPGIKDFVIPLPMK
jgi:hypothetical protein